MLKKIPDVAKDHLEPEQDPRREFKTPDSRETDLRRDLEEQPVLPKPLAVAEYEQFLSQDIIGWSGNC